MFCIHVARLPEALSRITYACRSPEQGAVGAEASMCIFHKIVCEFLIRTVTGYLTDCFAHEHSRVLPISILPSSEIALTRTWWICLVCYPERFGLSLLVQIQKSLDSFAVLY